MLESSSRDLQDLHIFAPLKRQNFSKIRPCSAVFLIFQYRRWWSLPSLGSILMKFCRSFATIFKRLKNHGDRHLLEGIVAKLCGYNDFLNFPKSSGNFPEISRKFRTFPEISRKFPEISGNFWKFPVISRKFPHISRKFPENSGNF